MTSVLFQIFLHIEKRDEHSTRILFLCLLISMRCRWTSIWKIIFPVKFSGVSPNLNSKCLTSWLSCNVLNPGKIFHPNSSKFLYSAVLLNHPNLSSHALLDWGFSRILPRHNTDSEKDVDLCALKTGGFLHHQSKTNTSVIGFPNRLFPLQKSHLVRTPILQICRTFVSVWDLLCSWWNANCLSNSFPWIQMIPTLKTWTFPVSRNVFHRLLQHSSKIVFVFSALDHSPYPRMIWILKTNPILFRRHQWWIAVPLLLFEDQHRVSPIFHEVLPHSQRIARFHHDEFPRERNQVGILVSLSKKLHRVSPVVRTSQYQFSTLEKTKHGHYPTLNSVLSARHGRQRVAPVYPFSQLSHSRGSGVHSFSSPGFLTPTLTELKEPLQQGSSLASTSLWLFLHPEFLCVLFDITSEQSVELKWLMLDRHERWSIRHVWNFPWSLCQRVVFFGVNVLDLDFWVQIDSIEQANQGQLCGSWKHVSRSHKSRPGIPSNLNPASKGMISGSVELCETEVCFLHIQLSGTNVRLPKMQCSSRSGFWILKISCKIGVLKTVPQPALFCSITHIAILFVFTCVMNVRYQSIQAFVTSFGPFCNRSCKFVHWP